MAERDADPREELVRAEGLAHVVVGADIEGGHLVALLTARRQHDDRDRGPLAQPADHVDAVDVRQPEVDDDDVRLARADLHQAVRAGRRLEQPIPLARQRGPKEAPDLGLVLDEDDDGVRHRRAPRAGAFLAAGNWRGNGPRPPAGSGARSAPRGPWRRPGWMRGRT